MTLRSVGGVLIVSALGVGLATARGAEVATWSKATVTETKNLVDYTHQPDPQRAAKTGDQIVGDDLLRTGERSLAELEFNDQTLTRLGANAIFSFKAGSRQVSLQQGLMLFHVPKGRGRSEIATAAVTAAITGTTGLVDVDNGIAKFIFLEGSGAFRIGKKTVKVKGTEMLMVYPDGKWVKAPINLALLFKTSQFLKEAEKRLHALDSWDSIEKNLADQTKEINNGRLIPTKFLVVGPADEMLTAAGEPAKLTVPDALNQVAPPLVAVTMVAGTDYQLNTGIGQEANVRSQAPSASTPFVPVGGTGVIQGQLIWTTVSDLDLHLVLPGDNPEVYYSHPTTTFNNGKAIAVLDHDNLGGTSDNQLGQRVENITVNKVGDNGAIPSGQYSFYVHNFNQNSAPSTVATLIVTGDHGVTRQVSTFTLTTTGQNTPSMHVTLP